MGRESTAVLSTLAALFILSVVPVIRRVREKIKVEKHGEDMPKVRNWKWDCGVTKDAKSKK
jgi:phosphoketolase